MSEEQIPQKNKQISYQLSKLGARASKFGFTSSNSPAHSFLSQHEAADVPAAVWQLSVCRRCVDEALCSEGHFHCETLASIKQM